MASSGKQTQLKAGELSSREEKGKLNWKGCQLPLESSSPYDDVEEYELNEIN